jgi:Transcription termination factor nusG
MKELACSSGESKNEADSAWYCLYSRRKQEHMAAAHVRLLGSIPVFCPRIRFRRQTRGGATVMVTEAMFPGYFFARFCLGEMLPQVRSAHGVSSIVRFGDWYPVIDDNVIEQLRVSSGVCAWRFGKVNRGSACRIGSGYYSSPAGQGAGKAAFGLPWTGDCDGSTDKPSYFLRLSSDRL